ncbi:MAG: oxidoreductase [Actinomycetota bacterium]|nr:MAG: oxidoreductase [Actinomycetota bacterium]
MTRSDVVVIGAGVHGASAAYHLASRGVRVLVVDPRGPAGGPTGRSSAICRAYYTNPFLAEVARDSIAMIRDLPERIGREGGFRHTGLLVLHPAEDEPVVREVVPRLNAQGIRTELLTPDDISARWPAFDLSGVALGAFELDAGYADPVLVTRGLLERARELGAETRFARRVAALAPDGSGWSVGLDDGERIACGRVLLAAGPWTRPLAALVGADLPLSVERHFVASFAWGGAERVPAHGDLPNGYYFRPEGEELFLVGPLHPEPEADPDGFREALAEAEAAEMAERVVRRVPALERAEARGGWASLYDVSPDWQPVIGEIAPGVFVDAGTSGHGFKLAPALGRHVADLVLGEDVHPELAQFHPRRFAEHRELGAGYGEARILG